MQGVYGFLGFRPHIRCICEIPFTTATEEEYTSLPSVPLSSMKNASSSFGLASFVRWVACILLLLVVVASAMGVYSTLFVNGGATFGTSAASLALLSFAVSLHILLACMNGCCCAPKK